MIKSQDQRDKWRKDKTLYRKRKHEKDCVKGLHSPLRIYEKTEGTVTGFTVQCRWCGAKFSEAIA